MSYFYILTLAAGLILSACSDTNTAKEPAGPAPVTVSEPSVEATTPATADAAPAEASDNYDEERKIINDFVDQVNRDLADLTLKKAEITMGDNTYEVLHYTDANGVLVKAKAVCAKDSWEIYAHPDASGPQKRVYASYLAETDNPYEPISKQYYHIGSMKTRDQAMVLALDEAVKPMSGADRDTWISKYEAAAAAITK